MKTFDEIFENCLNKLNGDERAAKMRFVIACKRNNPDVTMLDVRKYLGYYSSDEKKDAVESQKFRQQVLFPVRNFLTKSVLGIPDNEVAHFWARENKTESVLEQRKKINEQLPRVTRVREPKLAMINDLSDILNFDND